MDLFGFYLSGYQRQSETGYQRLTTLICLLAWRKKWRLYWRDTLLWLMVGSYNFTIIFFKSFFSLNLAPFGKGSTVMVENRTIDSWLQDYKNATNQSHITDSDYGGE